MPANSAAVLAMLGDRGSCMTQPRQVYSTRSAATPDRSSRSRMAMVASSRACSPLNPPPIAPIGVRTAPAITTFCMTCLQFVASGMLEYPCRRGISIDVNERPHDLRQQSEAAWNFVDDDALVELVCALADGAETVDGRGPDRGRNVGVGRTAPLDPGEIQSESPAEDPGPLEDLHGGLADLHRRPVPTSEDLDLAPSTTGFRPSHGAFEPSGFVFRPRANVDPNLRAGPGTMLLTRPPWITFGPTVVPLDRSSKFEHPENLVGRLDDGVDTELGLNTLVGGTPVDRDDILAGTLARQFEVALEVRRFEDEHDIGPSCGLLDERPGAGRPDLLVGVEESLDAGVGEAAVAPETAAARR